MAIKCKCNGIPERGMMCMYATVSGEFCTNKEYCKFQVKTEEDNEKDIKKNEIKAMIKELNSMEIVQEDFPEYIADNMPKKYGKFFKQEFHTQGTVDLRYYRKSTYVYKLSDFYVGVDLIDEIYDEEEDIEDKFNILEFKLMDIHEKTVQYFTESVEEK